MHGLDLILTLTGSLTAALVFGYVTHRVGLSPIAGYLLAGIAVGRHTPGFVADPGIANQLADIGVVLLMFGVGLQLHLRDLFDVRRIVVPGAVAQCVISALLGASVATAFGWRWSTALAFGTTLSIASTAVAVRVLTDRRELHTPTGHIAVGWLLVEDLLAVVVLVLLPTLFRTTSSPASLAAALGVTALKVAALMAVVALAGNRAIRWLLDLVAHTHSRELFTLTVLVLALGIAVGSAALFNVSMALGAFLAGMVVGRTDYGLRAASEALPMRDAFAVLFFVSIGMLLDPRYLIDAPGLTAATAAVVIVGTPTVAAAMARLRGVPWSTASRVGLALGQIGEFSFMLAAVGRELGVLGPPAINAIVAVSIVSIIANGPLYRLLGRIDRRSSRATVLVAPAGSGGPTTASSTPREWPPAAGDATAVGPAVEMHGHRSGGGGRHAVVVGYGPTGRTLTRLLRDNGLQTVLIEMNLDTVRRLRGEGVEAIYGDASYRDTLAAARVAAASHLIITADLADSREVIRLAREMNPRVQVLARTAHLRDVPALRASGADAVFSGEGEVALALTEAVLHRLGATPEQMDRERERAHEELFG